MKEDFLVITTWDVPKGWETDTVYQYVYGQIQSVTNKTAEIVINYSKKNKNKKKYSTFLKCYLKLCR